MKNIVQMYQQRAASQHTTSGVLPLMTAPPAPYEMLSEHLRGHGEDAGQIQMRSILIDCSSSFVSRNFDYGNKFSISHFAARRSTYHQNPLELNRTVGALSLQLGPSVTPIARDRGSERKPRFDGPAAYRPPTLENVPYACHYAGLIPARSYFFRRIVRYG